MSIVAGRRERETAERGEAGAAGGDDEVGGVVVAPGEELADDGHGVVADHGTRGHVVAERRRPVGGGGSAGGVVTLPARGGVGDSEDGDAHGNATVVSQ